MAIGYIGDTLYCVAAPGSSGEVYSYQFLLFGSETATSSTYLRESVGSKTYSSLSLSPLALAQSSASPQDISGYVTESLIMGITGWPVSKVASFLRMYGKYL